MTPVLLLGLLIGIGLPVLIGVYVYRDAKARGMDAALWTIIAVLAPSLIGLIVYLVVRGNSSVRRCAQCGAQVSVDFAVCPQCGAQLRNQCPNCKRAVEPDWHSCPYCGAPLPEMQPVTTAGQPSKDKLPGWLLALIIAVPVLILFFFGAIVFLAMA